MRLIYLPIALSVLMSLNAVAGPNGTYRRSDISAARYGVGDRAALLQKAYGLSAKINARLKGQHSAASALQERVVNYLESYGTRQKEPITANFVGLPGIGKSAMLAILKEVGFPVVIMDAQKYSGNELSKPQFANDVYNAIQAAVKSNLPLILAVEEIDKVPEINLQTGAEVSSELIGTLNQMLSSGTVTSYGRELRVSNIMVITDMNFSPEEMETFTRDVLKEEKSFYDLTIDDLMKFDQWVRQNPGARYKILSRIFRSNTVSRLAPNSIILKPLDQQDYRAIAEDVAKATVLKATGGANEGKRLTIDLDPSLLDFLEIETTFAPSGARETVSRAEFLIEQLVNAATKASDLRGGESIDRPRRLKLAYDRATNEAIVTITSQVRVGLAIEERDQFDIRLKFDAGGRSFVTPTELLQTTAPTYKHEVKPPRLLTQKAMQEARFPKTTQVLKDGNKKIAEKLAGQEVATTIMLDDMKKFLARKGPAKKEPSSRVLSGFPGIGKSELALQSAELAGLPVVRVNMQQFSSDSSEAIRQFFDTIDMQTIEARKKRPDGKYVLLLEELDKVFEIDPKGNLVNRPVIAIVKDLLNSGTTSVTLTSNYKRETLELDVRNAMTIVTMNFSVDRFNFRADPRLTTIGDVMKAWKDLSTTPMAMKEILGAMFLPDTVSRLMARFTIMKPLTANEHRSVIDKQSDIAVRSRLQDEAGVNRAQINVKLTARYKRYLFSETVIPSEGARNTVVGSQTRINSDLERALESIPRSSKYARSPLMMTLDFLPGTTSVVARVQRLKSGVPIAGEKPYVISKHVVALTFPPLNINGRVTTDRMKTSAHEFGHAFVAARLGLRFGDIVVVSPKPGIGGYVTIHDGNRTAQGLLGEVFALIASRAMEKMVLSDDPMSDKAVLDITNGPSSDIQMATERLYDFLYEYGLDPNGGTIDRNVIKGPGKYAAYQEMPSELAEKLGLIIRDLEKIVLKDLLASHNEDWYVSRIARLAKAGSMNEEEFYQLVDRKIPDADKPFTTSTKILRMFKAYVQSPTKADLAARETPYGANAQNVADTVKLYTAEFAEILRVRLHPDQNKVERSVEASKHIYQCQSLFGS